jgi:hypothetical protein
VVNSSKPIPVNGSLPFDFEVCPEQPAQSVDAKVAVACEVATDASALVIAVEPK